MLSCRIKFGCCLACIKLFHALLLFSLLRSDEI